MELKNKLWRGLLDKVSGPPLKALYIMFTQK